MLHFIREFKFGRPQQFAALLLIAFISLAVANAFRSQLYREALAHNVSSAYCGAEKLGASPPVEVARCEPSIAELSAGLAERFYTTIHGPVSGFHDPAYLQLAKFVRLPFVAFGVWLAGALWWVSRRLYDNHGGYVALALYCFSVPIIWASSAVGSDVIAAWGLYGMIYTAIGVAHTLYAPRRKWIPRIVLLGVSVGVTANAHMGAALIGVAVSFGFLLYLAPGRRLASCIILGAALLQGLFILVMLHGFRLAPLFLGQYAGTDFHLGIRDVFAFSPRSPQDVLLLALMLTSLVTFIAWRRTRYFGNVAPLVVAAVFLAISFFAADSIIWALPFVFTFIGGIFADLLETSGRKIVAWSLGTALAGYAALAVAAVMATPK